MLLISQINTYGQTITKETNSFVNGTVCPNTPTSYIVSLPLDFSTCQIEWTVTNGQINSANNQPRVSVTWNDTPGAVSEISVRFHSCPNGNSNEGIISSKAELILSVNNQQWGSFGNVVNIDFCSTNSVALIVPKMFVIGTGGPGQPPLQEVRYAWNLPPGWKTQSGATGQINTSLNSILILPDKCAVPGIVSVRGVIIDRCGSAGLSAAANISLNGVSPVVTVGPPPGFTGITVCETTPVNFTATMNAALGCISNFSWTFPSGWSLSSQNANSVTLIPNGTQAIQGEIKATVNFTCGSSITSAPIIPNFIPPEVLGPNLICTTGTFSVNNAPFASVTWSTSNNSILTIQSNGVATRQPKKRGSVTVSASFNCPQPPATKATWVGEPLLSNENLYVFGAYGQNPVNLNPSSYYYFDITKLISTNPDIYQRVDVPGASSYTWYVPSSFSAFANYGSRAILQTSSTNGTYVPYVAAENACGSGGARSITVVIGQGGGGGIILLTASPNPVSDELGVELEVPHEETERLVVTEDPKETVYALYDELGREVLRYESSTGKTKLDVRHVKEGLYILKALQGERVYVQRILIKR